MRLPWFLALFLSLPLWGQAQTGNLAWQHAYGTAGDETDGLAAAMPGGGYMLLGRYTYFNGQYSLPYFVRTNAQGDTLWTKYFHQFPHNTAHPVPTGIVADAAGNLLVTFFEQDSRTYSRRAGYVLKLTPTCDTIWTRTYLPTVLAGSYATQCTLLQPTITTDGNYTFLRRDASLFTSRPLVKNANSIFKINSTTGQLLWNTDLNVPITAQGLDATTISLNGFGYSNGHTVLLYEGYLRPGASMYGVLCLDAVGAVTTVKTYVGLGPTGTFSYTGTADGNVVVARRQSILKLSPRGDTLWRTVAPQAYQYRNWDAAAVVEDATGNLLVAANSQLVVPSQSAFATNVHLVRFSRAGALLNDTLLYRPGDTYARAVVLGPTGGDLVFSGYTTNGLYGGSDLLLARYARFRPLATQPGAALAAARLGLYPNPAAPGALVQAELPDLRGGTLRVYDALGRAVGQQLVPPGSGLVPVSAATGLPPGVYLLRFERADGRCATARLLRE